MQIYLRYDFSVLTCNFLTRKTNKHNKNDDHTEWRMKNSHTNSDGVVLRNQGSSHTKKPRKKEKHSAGDGCKQDTSTFTSVQLASPLASNGGMRTFSKNFQSMAFSAATWYRWVE